MVMVNYKYLEICTNIKYCNKGSTLHIATIMIDKTSGDSLKEYLTKDSTKGLPVTLSVSFDLVKSV